MMLSSTLLDEAAELSDSLTATEERIGTLRDWLKSFAGDNEAGYVPTGLPEDFDPAAAQAELNELLRKRHADNVKYKSLIDQQKAAQEAETKRALAAIRERYKEAIIRMLQAGIAFAVAVKDADSIRSEAFDLTGVWSSLYFVGPNLGHWNLWDTKDYSAPLAHWIREARDHGYISGSEDWLKGVTF